MKSEIVRISSKPKFDVIGKNYNELVQYGLISIVSITANNEYWGKQTAHFARAYNEHYRTKKKFYYLIANDDIISELSHLI